MCNLKGSKAKQSHLNASYWLGFVQLLSSPGLPNSVSPQRTSPQGLGHSSLRVKAPEQSRSPAGGGRGSLAGAGLGSEGLFPTHFLQHPAGGEGSGRSSQHLQALTSILRILSFSHKGPMRTKALSWEINLTRSSWLSCPTSPWLSRKPVDAAFPGGQFLLAVGLGGIFTPTRGGRYRSPPALGPRASAPTKVCLCPQIHMKTMPAAMYRLLTAQEQPVYI